VVLRAGGGGGGGGTGGLSVAIGHIGSMPTRSADTVIQVAAQPALGGRPGIGPPHRAPGKDGVAMSVLELAP